MYIQETSFSVLTSPWNNLHFDLHTSSILLTEEQGTEIDLSSNMIKYTSTSPPTEHLYTQEEITLQFMTDWLCTIMIIRSFISTYHKVHKQLNFTQTNKPTYCMVTSNSVGWIWENKVWKLFFACKPVFFLSQAASVSSLQPGKLPSWICKTKHFCQTDSITTFIVHLLYAKTK